VLKTCSRLKSNPGRAPEARHDQNHAALHQATMAVTESSERLSEILPQRGGGGGAAGGGGRELWVAKLNSSWFKFHAWVPPGPHVEDAVAHRKVIPGERPVGEERLVDEEVGTALLSNSRSDEEEGQRKDNPRNTLRWPQEKGVRHVASCKCHARSGAFPCHLSSEKGTKGLLGASPAFSTRAALDGDAAPVRGKPFQFKMYDFQRRKPSS